MKNKINFILTVVTAILFALWPLLLPLILGILLLIYIAKREKKQTNETNAYIKELEDKIATLGVNDYVAAKQKLDEINANILKQEEQFNKDVATNNELISKLQAEVERLTSSDTKLQKQLKTQTNKLNKIKELYKSVEYAIDNFLSYVPNTDCLKIAQTDLEELEDISPSVMLKLHCMDMKDLRKSYRENEKQIDRILSMYSDRYTTKSNRAIYQLMVIALRSELQNVLYSLKYEKLDTSVDAVKAISAKYLSIAGSGNQSIAGTLTKFIGEIEYLFINAVKIEYNYYVKKEQARQEQLAIREQMRQEAEERKALEQERKRVEIEESKFNAEIEKLSAQLATAEESEIEKLNKRILELQAQLSEVIVKKEEISNLQNGKAGNVYIISNLGSFGENMFKIGMTRRIEPQDRVNELGDASVPFKFDVHSFIFSQDASDLENKLHSMLNEKRVNKVNLRKEFFYSTIDELEKIVHDIEPTAEFNKTMLAEEFRQSLSTNEVYSTDYQLEDMDEE